MADWMDDWTAEKMVDLMDSWTVEWMDKKLGNETVVTKVLLLAELSAGSSAYS